GSPEMRPFAQRAYEIRARWLSEGVISPVESVPAYWLISEPKLEALRAHAGSYQLVEASHAELDRLRKGYPGLIQGAEERVLSAVGFTISRYDPVSTVNGIVRQLAGPNFDLFEATRVARLDGDRDGCVLSTACGNKLEAARVLLCVGPWLARTLGA